MTTSFAQFEREALAQGFDSVLERRWAPQTAVVEHTHPFDAKALMVAGELWLTVGTETQHLQPGDGFELLHDTPHAERYGTEGATFWVARRQIALV